MQLGNLAPQIFAPGKMVFIAYVILVWLDARRFSWWSFVGVVFVLFAAEIIHNDWFRILLNRHAEGSRWAMRAAQVEKVRKSRNDD